MCGASILGVEALFVPVHRVPLFQKEGGAFSRPSHVPSATADLDLECFSSQPQSSCATKMNNSQESEWKSKSDRLATSRD